MDKVVLLDGSEYNVEWVGVSGTLSAQLITDKPFSAVTEDFDNPEKTAVLVYHYNNKTAKHEGFTNLHMMQRSESGYLIMLMKG